MATETRTPVEIHEARAYKLREALSGLLIFARGNDHVLGLIHGALEEDDRLRVELGRAEREETDRGD